MIESQRTGSEPLAGIGPAVSALERFRAAIDARPSMAVIRPALGDVAVVSPLPATPSTGGPEGWAS